MTPSQLNEANAVLRTFRSHLTFDLRAGRLYLVYNHDRYPAVRPVLLSKNGTHPVTGEYGEFGCGGTYTACIVQLVHWLRGKPRRPLRFWELWLGEESEAVQLLKRTDYGSHEKTCCVLCGNPEPGDWLLSGHPSGKIGPLCFYGECEKARTA